MKDTSFLRIALGVLGLSTALCLAPHAVAQLSPNLDMALRGLSSEDPAARGQALYDMLAIGQWGGQAPRGIANLFRVHPDQAESIKTALIRALELQSAYFEVARQQNLIGSRTEFDSEVWANLIWAVAYLRDSRALNGLLGAIRTGGMATGGLADLGPVAVDALVERSHSLDADVRAAAAQVLGGFLTRQETVRSNPEAAVKARRAITDALDDPEPWVRRAAVGSTLTFKEDPDVKVRLEAVAASDPEIEWGSDGKATSTVRATAARVLNAKEADFFYVMRIPESGECRVQKVTDVPEGVRSLGPFETSQTARNGMCQHYDDTSKNSALCWSVQPKDACNR